MLTGRKAIGEIVGALTLMLIVSIAGTLLFTISLRSQDEQGNILRSQIKEEGDSAQERFTNLHTYVKKISDDLYEVHIFIYNYGEIEVRIKSIYINNPENGETININLDDAEGLLRSNQIKHIIKNIDREFSVYEINLVSERGVKNVSKWLP